MIGGGDFGDLASASGQGEQITTPLPLLGQTGQGGESVPDGYEPQQPHARVPLRGLVGRGGPDQRGGNGAGSSLAVRLVSGDIIAEGAVAALAADHALMAATHLIDPAIGAA